MASTSGATSLGQASTQFPDLQYKMSKKVAQLTKVIYHLNNKTEDHDFELQDLAGQYESEIEHILREAAERIKNFKEAMEVKREEGRVEAAVADLTARYESARKAALAEFEAFKQRAKDREAALQRASEARLETLTKEVEQMKDEFGRRVDEFRKAREAGDASAAAAEELRKTHRKEVESLTLAHQQELSDSARHHNQRLQQLAAERAAVEEELRLELQRTRESGSTAVQDLTHGYDARLEAQKVDYEDRIAQMEGARAESDAAAKAEGVKLQETMSSLRLDLTTAEGRARGLEEALARERRELESTRQGLERETATRTELEVTLGTARLEAADVAANLRTSQADAEDLRSRLESTMKEAREARSSHAHSSSEKDVEIQRLSRELREEQEERRKAARELAVHTNKADALQRDLKTAKKAHELALGSAKDIKEELVRLKEETLRREQDAKRTLAVTGSEAAKRTSELETEITRLRTEVIIQSKDSADKARREMQKKLDDAAMEHAHRMQHLEAEHKRQSQGERVSAAAQLAAREAALQEDMEVLRKKLAAEREAAVAEMERKLEEARRAAQDEVEESNRKLEEMRTRHALLEGDVGSLGEKLTQLREEGEERALKADQVKSQLEGQLSASVKEGYQLRQDLQERAEELDRTKRARDEATGRAERLAVDCEVGGRESKRSLKEAMERAAQDLQRTNMEWARKADEKMKEAMAASERHHLIELRDLREQLESRKEAEKADLLARLGTSAAGREEELLLQLQQAATERDRLLAKHKAALDAAALDADREKKTLEDLHTRAMAAAEATSTESLEALRQSLREEQAAAEAAGRKRLAEEEQRHDTETQAITMRHKDEGAALLAEWRGRLASETAAAAKALTEAKAALIAEHKRERHAMEEGQKEAVRKLKESIAALEKSTDDKENAVNSLRSDMRRLHDDLAEAKKGMLQKNAELVTTREDLLRDMRRLEAALKAEHQRELEALVEENLEETRALQEGFQYAKRVMEGQLADVQAQLSRLQARFDTRESRPEDVARISSLEREVAVKEAEFRRLFEDTKQIRLELINREENYNKMFAAQPKVAQDLVDWLKPKAREPNASSSLHGSSGPSRSARASLSGSSSNRSPGLPPRRASDHR